MSYEESKEGRTCQGCESEINRNDRANESWVPIFIIDWDKMMVAETGRPFGENKLGLIKKIVDITDWHKKIKEKKTGKKKKRGK